MLAEGKAIENHTPSYPSVAAIAIGDDSPSALIAGILDPPSTARSSTENSGIYPQDIADCAVVAAIINFLSNPTTFHHMVI